jgi:hypothetical protein
MSLTATSAVILLLFKRWYLLLPTLTRICVHVLWDRCCEAKHRFYRIRRLIGSAMFQRRRIPNSSVTDSVPHKQCSYTNNFNVQLCYFNTLRFFKQLASLVNKILYYLWLDEYVHNHVVMWSSSRMRFSGMQNGLPRIHPKKSRNSENCGFFSEIFTKSRLPDEGIFHQERGWSLKSLSQVPTQAVMLLALAQYYFPYVFTSRLFSRKTLKFRVSKTSLSTF